MKDLIHKIMNIAVPLTSLISAVLTLPIFWLFKLINFLVIKPLSIENVAGKVVLITGASSGIGEQVAYEYAKRGACLALVDIREEPLPVVANKAKQLGSPDVIVMKADVSNIQDCKNFVDQTILHFHTLDHLVNNAGIASVSLFQDYTDITHLTSLMNINFWGTVYTTQFAIPYLKQSKGKIIVMASAAGWLNWPRLSIYGATKAALISFFETLRAEMGSEIGITIATPGLIKTDMTNEDNISKGKGELVPLESKEGCAQAIVNGTRRRDRFVIEPGWYTTLFYWKLFCPELLDCLSRLLGGITWWHNDPQTLNINYATSQAPHPTPPIVYQNNNL